jgi:hypothetical protein
MLPPKPCALPEYHQSICLSSRLMVFSLHRSAATPLPSRTTPLGRRRRAAVLVAVDHQRDAKPRIPMKRKSRACWSICDMPGWSYPATDYAVAFR